MDQKQVCECLPRTCLNKKKPSLKNKLISKGTKSGGSLLEATRCRPEAHAKIRAAQPILIFLGSTVLILVVWDRGAHHHQQDMESNTLSLLSPLATLRVLSSEKLAPTNCYILRSYNHFLKHFSSSTTNLKLGTPQAILNTSPIAPSEVTTPTLRELCQSHVPEHILQRQIQNLSLLFFLS